MRPVRVDAHLHFWRYEPSAYPWIDARMQAIARDFLPDDVEADLDACGFDGGIAVQARGSDAETRFLLDLARQHPRVLGVVGWVDLCADDVAARLEALDHPALKGVRHIVQDEPDDAFLLRPDFQRGVRALGPRGLVYDVLVYPRQLDAAIAFVSAFPEQPFVLDHLAKPDIRGRMREPWESRFRELAERPNVCCKLSGMVTEARWREWQAGDFERYLDTALEAFSEDRLLFGSDWPVCLLAAEDYAAVHELVLHWSGRLSPNERARLFGGNAQRVYGLS